LRMRTSIHLSPTRHKPMELDTTLLRWENIPDIQGCEPCRTQKTIPNLQGCRTPRV
jgi:hypothetical protein